MFRRKGKGGRLYTPVKGDRSTPLEELHLLNCDLDTLSLSLILECPRALKHFTFKGQSPPMIFSPPFRDKNRGAYIDVLKSHASSLESLDLDLYDWWEEPINLSDFKVLKRLAISTWMLTGDGNETKPLGKVLPSSLEQITFRSQDSDFHFGDICELVRSGELRHLSSLSCQLPSDWSLVSPEQVLAEQCNEYQSFAQAFDELGVQLSVVRVPEPAVMPENETCPCPCWTYWHRWNDSYDW